MKIIVDSNIVFSSLLSKDNNSKLILVSNKFDIYSCNFLFKEIFNLKEKIKDCSKLKEDDILLQLEKVTGRINFVREEVIPKEIYKEAYNLCKDIDEDDTPFIALSIFLKAHLLTGDKRIYKKLKENNINVLTLREAREIYLKIQ